MQDWHEERLSWTADGKAVEIGMSRLGSGPLLLLLPALSSISSRKELEGVQQLLAADYETLSVDWPGFGDLPRPKVNWRPELYRDFLRFLVTKIAQPVGTLAAGHAAAYAVSQAADAPGSLGRLGLLAPTWRGPLPTMMSKRHKAFKLLSRGVDLPVLGGGFYRLNVNGPVINFMLKGHVYQNADFLDEGGIAQKREVTEAKGARYASFRFVSGELDAYTDRQSFHADALKAGDDIVMVYGANSPRKSKAEMLALAALDNVTAREVAQGKLSFYEEFPDLTFAALKAVNWAQ